MYAAFDAETQGDRINNYDTQVTHVNGRMVICAVEGPIYITKAQAMAFFGLVEPVKPSLTAYKG